MENQSFENDCIHFELRDGILFGRYKVFKLDLATAQSATAFRKQVLQGRKMPAVADISSIKHVDKKTRQYVSSPQAGEDLTALAVIINNPVTRMMGNFFVKFHQPEYPFRFFTNVEEATEWIKKFA